MVQALPPSLHLSLPALERLAAMVGAFCVACPLPRGDLCGLVRELGAAGCQRAKQRPAQASGLLVGFLSGTE